MSATYRPYFAALVVCLAAVQPRGMAAAELPDLSITLAETNSGNGLHVPSAGDGTNEAVAIGGHTARRAAGAKSHYLYVGIRDPAYAPGPRDVYVTAEVFDDKFGYLELDYDRASDAPNLATYYSRASPVLMTNCGCWRRAVYHLPDLRIGHGQNLGADFRFAARSYAIRSISISLHPPEGYDPETPVNAEALRSVSVSRPEGMELTFGNDATPDSAALFKAIGVSSVESYVDWAGVEPEERKWDWRAWDKQVAVLQRAKLKWVPFLIAGPAYATPLWFQRGPNSHVFRCLEHGSDSAVQSLFNPELRPQIERFVHAFAAQYEASGVIESILLGVSGIYGESIYPAGPEGGWTARLTGDYHNHHGWWAGDPLAVAAFRAAMQAKYGTISALNREWTTHFASFADVECFLPADAPGDRARADFVEWYQQAMTDWAVFWVKTVREAFPTTEIYLCTGGDGDPMLGADFTAQAKAIAAYRAGIRITNEASDYSRNFTMTREVATATRLYATFCGFEPASGVSPAGNVARIYNATASGARQLHCYTNNLLDGGEFQALELYRANLPWLVPRQPLIDVAMYVPRETWALDPSHKTDFYELSRRMRSVSDHDYVTRCSVADGALRDQHVLVLAASPVLEQAAAVAIEEWVKRGGTLIAATRPGEAIGSRLYDNAAWRGRIFAAETSCDRLLEPSCDAPPTRWRLAVGGEDDGDWLPGDWNVRETGSMWPDIAGTTMRWTGARSGVLLPTKPGADYLLRIACNVPGAALGTSAIIIRINDHEVGRITAAGRHELEFRVPDDVVGPASVARLELAVTTWKPTDHGLPGDTRSLGIAVRQIEWIRTGSEQDSAGPATLLYELNRTALDAMTHRVGNGSTILLSGLMPDFTTIARVVASKIPEPPDGQSELHFATRTRKGGILWLDTRAATITESQ